MTDAAGTNDDPEPDPSEESAQSADQAPQPQQPEENKGAPAVGPPPKPE
jgi:hypothetical protein